MGESVTRLSATSPLAHSMSPGVRTMEDMTEARSLTDRELAILAYEREVENLGTFSKDAAVLDRFHVTHARYVQELHLILDNPVALEHDPQLVKRLIRIRDQRISARANRTFRSVA